ncbi:unnamed protein product [Cercopithifilaria johnstoni]|uniref:Domain of unknown function DB domain-containing protein n=1 Tax=Cercopithifilaria johnstoni TaxID=2874296 RepID=A0A8J2Q8F6_9BILA|nr:unnamed protein product [Cercopithifilaria johnstoni]
MLSGQQTWFVLPLQSQNQQTQNSSIFTIPTESLLQQSQIENHPRNFQKNLLATIHGTQQQQQQQQQQVSTGATPELVSYMNNDQMLRHRDLPIEPIVHHYHQKAVNETYTTDTAKRVPFPNNNPSQFSMNENGTSLNTEIPSTINVHHHPFASESQSNKQLVKFGTRSNARQQQLPELASLRLALLHIKVPASTISNRQSLNTSRSRHSSSRQFISPYILKRLSGVQPRAQRRPEVSQLPILAIVTSEPNDPTQQFAPRRLSQTSTLDRALLEPVLASQTTTLQPAHTSLKQNRSPIAAEDIRAALLSANNAFLECCKEKNIDAKCESRCNFDIIDRRLLTAMFVGSDPCPRSNGRSLLSCAAQDSDHTNCCRERGVQQTAAGDKCLRFCQMTPGSNFQADVSMLPCWGVLKKIKHCFRLSLIEKHNIQNAT